MAIERKKTAATKDMPSAVSGTTRSKAVGSSAQSTAATPPREELLVSAKSFERQAGEAIWSQIARSVEEQIVVGNLPSGTRLPTETQLAESFKVNRHTLRRALRELVRKGLITATPRRGTIVSRRRIAYPISGDQSFGAIIRSAGREPADRLLARKVGVAPKAVSEWLGIAERSDVVDLRILRVANDVPICLMSAWLPADRFERIGNLFERIGCLEKALAKLGVGEITLNQTRITSQQADSEEIQGLEISKGTAVLVVDSMFVDETAEPILVCHNRFAAERIELLVGT